MSQHQFSEKILNVGFIAALVLAGVAFCLAGFYLIEFAASTQQAVALVLKAAQGKQSMGVANVELMQNALGVLAYVARVLLISCGMFVGLAFGFLGFALFLVGAGGSSDISGEFRGVKATISALAPGTLALLAATVLVVVCVNRPLPAEISLGGATPTHSMVSDTVTEPAEGDPLLRPQQE
ncbi:hypothetical protein RCH14_000964 [Massilia sp. MP_M2]|uniref:hypothetical protein n=1 Tax=Massilia sp. MP_M2 TaxID=3071713 RepID=UPI00319E674B